MYCKNCGKEIPNTDNYCSNCGALAPKEESVQTPLPNNDSNVEEQQEKKEVPPICVFSLVLYFCTFTGAGIIPALIGLVLMIIARIKYPKSTFGKVLMWLYILMTIFYIILIVLIVSICGSLEGLS